MSTHEIPVVINPNDLRTFRVLDRALEQLRKHVIDTAADLTKPAHLTLSFSIHEGKDR